MANFVLRLSIQEGDLHRFLRKLNLKLENKVEINRRIGETVVGLTDERFQTQTDPEGQPWQDLRASTDFSGCYSWSWRCRVDRDKVRLRVPAATQARRHWNYVIKPKV